MSNMYGPESMSKTKQYYSIRCPIRGCPKTGWKTNWSECQGWLVNHLTVSEAESHTILTPEERNKLINTTNPEPLSDEDRNAWFEHERNKREAEARASESDRVARSSSQASGPVEDRHYEARSHAPRPSPTTPRRRSRSRRRSDRERERDRDRDRRRDRAGRAPEQDHEEPPPEHHEEELHADEFPEAQQPGIRPTTANPGITSKAAPGIRPTTAAIAEAVKETISQMGIQPAMQQVGASMQPAMQPAMQPPLLMQPPRQVMALTAPGAGAPIMTLSQPLQSANGGNVLVCTQFLKNIGECITRAQNACHMAKILSQKSVGLFANEEAILGACHADIEKALNIHGATLHGPT